MPQKLSPLRLKKGEDNRIRAGHLWIYSNEISKETPLKTFEPGQPVEIQTAGGSPVGAGYVNPHSLICARVVSRSVHQPLSKNLLVNRIENALKLREAVFDQPYYRLIYSEGDFLPGLIVDRYGDVLVAQLNTAGMDAMAEDVLLALCKVLDPKGVLWRNDSNVRVLEGLEKEVKVAGGEVPDSVTIVENGALFEAPLLTGQKTGWFYDQRDNRARLKRYVKDKSVLDVCSYVGGWSITSLMMGAKSATAVDQSEHALKFAMQSAEKNGVEDRLSTIQDDCFAALKALKRKGRKFDVIVVDPPAFIKRRKDIKEGMLAYQRLNALAMELLVEGGILISCSCSFHMNFRDLQTAVSRSAAKLGRSIQLLERGRQSIDHPCHMNIPETEYLKAIYCRLA